MRFCLLLLALFLFACNSSTNTADKATAQPAEAPTKAVIAPSTAAMAAQLQTIYASLDPTQDPYINSRRVEACKRELSTASNTNELIQRRFNLATQSLWAGQTREAIAIAEELVAELEAGQWSVQPEHEKIFQLLLGICYMRLGEQENCQNHHTNESCILPFSKKAQHGLPEGSTKAVAHYTKYLEKYPGDPGAIWLLNVAYMTLGQYPDKVPAKWRIPADAFQSAHTVPKFTDVAGFMGLNTDALAGGTVTEDFDNDGHIDIMCSSWRMADQVELFHNNGDGSFTNVTDQAGITGITGGLNMVHADYDNDGFVDVLILRGAWMPFSKHPNSLLHNNGDGTFTDVTRAAGIYSEHPTQAAAWGDFNNDGFLDVVIVNEATKSYNHPIELFQNNGDGTFTDVGNAAGLTAFGMMKGVAWGDVNNDGKLDLYVSNLHGANSLYINNGADGTGNWTFTDKAQAAGVQEPLNSFPTWMFDFDNDGHLDIFVSAYDMRWYNHVAEAQAMEYLKQKNDIQTPKLYRNKGDGTFEDVTGKMQLNKPLFTMGCNYGDIDNDGFLDFYLGTGEPDFQAIVPNRMFRNNKGKSYQDVTSAGGFGHLQKGHAIAFADLDNDGDQDIYATMGGAYEGDNFQNVLYLNPGSDNNWVTLRLTGVTANRSAIGARVKVTASGPDGTQSIHVVTGTGGSFGSQSLQQEIGLGSATSIDEVTVEWPGTGEKQVWTNLEINKIYGLTQAKNEAVALNIPALTFPTEGSGGHVHQHH